MENNTHTHTKETEHFQSENITVRLGQRVGYLITNHFHYIKSHYSRYCIVAVNNKLIHSIHHKDYGLWATQKEIEFARSTSHPSPQLDITHWYFTCTHPTPPHIGLYNFYIGHIIKCIRVKLLIF